jgi:putative hydrolase of the HAD superfamily
MQVIFFDIGGTLAVPLFAADGGQLEGFEVFPEARAALEALRRLRGVRLGVLSNTGAVPVAAVNRELEACGLLGFLDPGLIIYREKSSPTVFTEAAKQAGVAPQECLFVGENGGERMLASEAGFRVASSPAQAVAVLEGKPPPRARPGEPSRE